MNLLSGIQQDFHHAPQNPGAYEWWHFDGEDDHNGCSFSAQFHAGHLLSPYYQESLRTYWKKTKSPLVEKTPTPVPQPQDFSGVAFRVFRKGVPAGEFFQEYQPGQLKVSDHHPAFLLGSNRFHWEEGGNPPSYNVTLQGTMKGRKRLLRARFFFTPLPTTFLPFDAPQTTSTHTWVLPAPRCHVEGTLQWCDADGNVRNEEPFVGKGYHDHHFGTVPLNRFVKGWRWGRIFAGERTIVYSVRFPVEEKEGPSCVILALEGEKAVGFSRKAVFHLGKMGRNFYGLSYPKVLEFSGFPSEGDSIRIGVSRILSDGPVSLVLADEALCHFSGKTVKGSGLSNFVHAPRLSSRLFFPLLKGKTAIIERPRDFPNPLSSSDDVSITRPSSF